MISFEMHQPRMRQDFFFCHAHFAKIKSYNSSRAYDLRLSCASYAVALQTRVLSTTASHGANIIGARRGRTYGRVWTIRAESNDTNATCEAQVCILGQHLIDRICLFVCLFVCFCNEVYYAWGLVQQTLASTCDAQEETEWATA